MVIPVTTCTAVVPLHISYCAKEASTVCTSQWDDDLLKVSKTVHWPTQLTKHSHANSVPGHVNFGWLKKTLLLVRFSFCKIPLKAEDL